MRKRQRTVFIASFLAPAVLLYGVFVVVPLLQAFQLSTFRWRGVSAHRTFVGLDNFKQLSQDDVFRTALSHNLWLFLVGGAILIATAVAVAHGMQGKSKTARMLRGVVLFPQVISLVVVAILWMFLYNPSFGLLTGTLKAIGLEDWVRPWLGVKSTALPAVGIAFLWYAVGFYIMLFAAGLKQIPEELNEAASLDGSSGFHRFRTVTWPMLWSVKKIAWTYVAINVMNVFALVYLMTQGGPDRGTEVMLTYLYEQAFKNGQFGYSTALATANFAVAMLLSVAVMVWYRRDPSGARAGK